MAVRTPAIKCARTLLFVLNLIFMGVAILLLVIGAKFYSGYIDYEMFLETPYFSPAGIVISVGVILLVVSFLGYAGTWKESVCCINFYSLLLTVILILEIGGAITALIISNKAFNTIRDNMQVSIHQYKDNLDFQRTWDKVQQDLNCCGAIEPYEWSAEDVEGTEVILHGRRFHVPKSCCLGPDNCSREITYKSGCWSILKLELSSGIKVLGYSVLNIAILQLIGIVFSGVLAKNLRRAKSLEEMNRQAAAANSYAQQRQRVNIAIGSTHAASAPSAAGGRTFIVRN